MAGTPAPLEGAGPGRQQKKNRPPVTTAKRQPRANPEGDHLMLTPERPLHIPPRQDNYDRLIGLVIDYGSARERHGYLMGAPAEPQVKRDDAGRHRDICFERVMDELARVLGVTE